MLWLDSNSWGPPNVYSSKAQTEMKSQKQCRDDSQGELFCSRFSSTLAPLEQKQPDQNYFQSFYLQLNLLWIYESLLRVKHCRVCRGENAKGRSSLSLFQTVQHLAEREAAGNRLEDGSRVSGQADVTIHTLGACECVWVHTAKAYSRRNEGPSPCYIIEFE